MLGVHAPAAREAVAPLADVPITEGVQPGNPNNKQVKLIVQAAGDRTGANSVAPAEGAVFELFSVGKNVVKDGNSLGKCRTDDKGRCGIITTLDSKNSYFYAVGISNDAWSAADTWGTSDNELIRFTSGKLSGGNTFQLRGNNTAWPFVRKNPAATQKCGINMAVVFDLSGSVTKPIGGDTTPTMLSKYKTAGKGFVDALAGTTSKIAIKTFASQAPAKDPAGKDNVGVNAGVALTSVAQTADATKLKKAIDGFGPPPESNYYTNWDAGLAQVETDKYDVVLFLTDGDPTTYGPGTKTTSGNATLQTVEEAIYSANNLKAPKKNPIPKGDDLPGTRVIAVGINKNKNGFPEANKQRLRLISGPEEDSDFFTADFDSLGETISGLATKDCEGTVSVVKSIQGDKGQLSAGANWEFTTSTAKVTAGTGNKPVGNTNEDGALLFTVAGYTDVTNRDVTIAETQQTGYELVKQGVNNAKNAVCINKKTKEEVPVSNSGDLGFTVNVPQTVPITCTVINKKLTSSISLVKTAKTYNGGKPINAGADVPSGTRVEWSYTVTNTGTTTLNDIFVDDDRIKEAVSCPSKTLAPKASMVCTANGPVEALPAKAQ